MADKYKITRKKWNEAHQDIIKRSQAKYNSKNPMWGFRPSPELREWLEEERWMDDQDRPESNAALLIRKLEKLKKLEEQGY